MTSFNHKLLVYVSPLPDPQAWEEDEFHIPWDHLEAYAFSLFTVIKSVSNILMMSDGFSLVLVAPLRPHRQ